MEQIIYMYSTCISDMQTLFDTCNVLTCTVTPNFVLLRNGPADLIRLPEMGGPFQAALNGPTLPVLVR